MTFAHRGKCGVVRLDVPLLLATSRVHDLLVLHSVHVLPQAIRFVFGFLACFSTTRATCHRTDISAKPYPRDSRNWIILDVPLWMYSRRLLQDYFERPLSFSGIWGNVRYFGQEKTEREGVHCLLCLKIIYRKNCFLWILFIKFRNLS